MANVLIEPLGVQVQIEPNESVMEAAERAGYRWPTLCGGVAMCTMCWVRIESGSENATPMRDLEREALEMYRWQEGAKPEGDVRLGCQLKVTGDVTVFKRGVNVAGRAGVYR
ncbi:MAG: 2Fe-2S iron-sulfur cluster-binding protein [Dehalococcoidia bacterium]